METSTSVDPKDFPWEFRPGAVRTKTSFPAPLGTAGAGAGTAGAADGRLGKAGPGLTAFYGFLFGKIHTFIKFFLIQPKSIGFICLGNSSSQI